MDEKDKQIERLFDDYASSLQPNERLADRAKQKMQSKQKQKQRTKRSPAFWCGLAAACSAFVVVVFAAVALLGRNSMSGGNDKPNDSSTAPSVNSYQISEVRAVAVDENFAKDYLAATELEDAQIFSKNYYACYIKDTNEFVYLKAVLGVSYNGGNIQMSIVAENPDYVNEQRAQDYFSEVNGSGYRYHYEYIHGEYVTKAYCVKDGYKYYVSAMGNASGAQTIAAELIGVNS